MKNNTECQRECRARKKKYGRYITIFVPNDIADKIKGKPSVLIQSFIGKKELIKTVISMDKKIAKLEKEKHRLGMLARDYKRRLNRIYNSYQKSSSRRRETTKNE